MTTSKTGRSRLEINFRRLLARCELMAKENSPDDWRLEKFISSLEEMFVELEKVQNPPGKEMLSNYSRRIDFLKGLMDTNKMASPVEKVVASQLLSPVPDTVSKETHHKTVTKYTKELRDELLGEPGWRRNNGGARPQLKILRIRICITDMPSLIKDMGPRQRHTVSAGEDLDSVLKSYNKMQESISDNMLSMARNMKQKSQLAGEIIKGDIEVVDKSSALTEKNFSQLRAESVRLQEHSRHSCKCWLWIMLAAVIVVFINMVLFIKVMKKRSY